MKQNNVITAISNDGFTKYIFSGVYMREYILNSGKWSLMSSTNIVCDIRVIFPTAIFN